MNFPMPLVIPVKLGVLTNGESALIQDVANGELAERMSDSDLALAVLDIAADADAFSMNYAILDEAARRLAPEVFAEPSQSSDAPGYLARLAAWIRSLPVLGLLGIGAGAGAFCALAAVYAFVTHATHIVVP